MSPDRLAPATPEDDNRPAVSAEARPSTPEERRAGRARRPGARDPAAAYRRIAWSLILLVLVPSGLLIAVGTILLVRGTPDWNLVLGILVLVFVGLLATGTTLVWVFIAKETGLSQLQTDFVSKVSHELRTPLTSIRMFVDTLRLRRASNPVQMDECLDLLARETVRLTERIDQLLEWGRMEAGRRIYDLRPDDIGDVVREALEHFAPLQLQGDAEVRVRIDPDAPRVLVDRPAMVMAILNLLSNAYKYGGHPREIDVEVEKVDAGHAVEIRVRDNGEGIPRAEHKRIFQKFYRRDDRLSRKQEGSGLGLSIVTHVARGHRGEVRLDSEPGKGSTFILELPAFEGEEE
ncbi:MAG: HAMP domain-containing histidine kinase [Deltaproteobacteria bacterium]|nr:HAMP domain-containing histidine kinase [Deltaproteobacteria bacterium]